MGDGKNMAARIGGTIWRLFKKHLLGNFEMTNMIVVLSETVSRPEVLLPFSKLKCMAMF